MSCVKYRNCSSSGTEFFFSCTRVCVGHSERVAGSGAGGERLRGVAADGDPQTPEGGPPG